jgi:hypothetical protein
MPIQSQGGIFVAPLSHCRIANVANLLACRTHAAATASRHLCIAVAVKVRCVLAEVRWALRRSTTAI